MNFLLGKLYTINTRIMMRSRRPSVQSQIIHVKPINPVESDMEEAIEEAGTGGQAVQFAPGNTRPNNPRGAQGESRLY